MKKSIFIASLICLCTIPAFSGETTTRNNGGDDATSVQSNTEEHGYSVKDEENQTLGYICEGTRWELAYLDDIPEVDADGKFHFKTILMREWIEGTEQINGQTYMKVWTATDKDDYQSKELTYIRTEGEKVYMLNHENTEDERLIFDFSLTENQEKDVTFVLGSTIADWGQCSVQCLSEGEDTYDANTYKTLQVNLLVNGELMDPMFMTPAKWIKGIGSSAGILDNFFSPEIGGFRLSEVYHNDELVYKVANTSDIDNMIIDSPLDIEGKKYHIDGREFKDGETGVCIHNGKKTLIR